MQTLSDCVKTVPVNLYIRQWKEIVLYVGSICFWAFTSSGFLKVQKIKKKTKTESHVMPLTSCKRYIVVVFQLLNWSDSATPNRLQHAGFPVLCHLLQFAQTHVHWVSDAIQPSHPLLFPSPHAVNLFQHLGLYQWVGSTQLIAYRWPKYWSFSFSIRSFQWIFRTNFL